MVLHSCAILEAWLLREDTEPDLAAIDELTLSRWVKFLELMYAPRTVKRMRGDVIGVLNDAADAGLRTPLRSRRVRSPNVPPPTAEAWRVEIVRQLIEACPQLPGQIGTGIRRAVYFEALYRCAWRTALRRMDLWQMRLRDIASDGRVFVVQRKTRVATNGKLGPIEIKLLHSFGYDQPLRWPGAERQFYYWSRKLKALAEVKDEGHLQRVRKSAATDVARRDRSLATKLLGHTSAAADAFYIDESLLDNAPVEPTELDLPPRLTG
jgi:integrase